MATATNHFITGDIVVYPGHGVGTVVGTKSEVIGKQDTELLIVAFEVGMKLRIPVANIKKSGLRRISSRHTMEDALSALGEPRSQKTKSMWRHRALAYAAKMKTADPRAIAEIVRDLYRAPGDTEGSYSEKELYQQAWDHLIPEIAAVDCTDTESAANKVTGLLAAA
jgi:CarD family transcriptional regulator